jgi:serine protease
MRARKLVPAASRLAVIALCATSAGSRMPTTVARADDGVRVAAFAGERLPENDPRARAIESRVVVEFKAGVDDSVAERCIEDAGAARARRSAFTRRYVIEPLSGIASGQLVARLRSMPEVAIAETDGVVRAHFSPNDRLYALQWHLRTLNAERMWDIQKGDSSVAVAVLDTGVAFEDFGRFRKAPDFGGTVFLPGFNVYTKDAHANDDNFHGTHVASIIAEATNNGDGASGIAHLSAIMPVKVLGADGLGGTSEVAEGIDYVVNFRQAGVNPVKVINLSLGSETRSSSMEAAINRAVEAGITVVASAGNDDRSVLEYPAAFSNVIAVGALDARKLKAPYSNFGPGLDLMAPVGDIRRDDTGDGRPDGVLQQTMDPDLAEIGIYDSFAYYFVVGTSQAAPQVSALAALLSRQGVKSPAAIQALMEKTAEDLGTAGRDDTFGHGMIRPAEALKGLGLSK